MTEITFLTNDRLDPWVNWTTLSTPFAAALAISKRVDVYAPPPLHAPKELIKQVITDKKRPAHFFWMQGSARPDWPYLASILRHPTTPRSVFVVDAWRPALKKLALANQILGVEHCLIPFREAVVELRNHHGASTRTWFPFGIDSNTFHPRAGRRDIFAFSMGRRHEPLHRALETYCEQHELKYVFRRPGERFYSPQELGELASRSRYFVVTPPDLDDPVRTGGFSPLVMRYLEGLAAGARLLGVLPRSGEYEALLPSAGITLVSADGSNLAAQLDQERLMSVDYERQEHYADQVLRHHSWSRRADQLLALLDGDRPEFYQVTS